MRPGHFIAVVALGCAVVGPWGQLWAQETPAETGPSSELSSQQLPPPPVSGRQEETPATGHRAAPAVAGESGRQQPPEVAASPGRRESPPPAAPVTGSGTPDWSWRDAEVAEAFECPMRPIAQMLSAAQGKSEFSPAMELEREVLVLCRDRWEVLKEMMDAELSLVEVLRADQAERERQAIELEERRQLARARIEGARQGAIEAAKEVAARELVEVEPAKTPARPVEPDEPEKKAEAEVVVVQKALKPEEVYGWFAMMGSGSDLRAGVSDGNGRWWVRVGDALPGGVHVTGILPKPPRVMVKGGPPSGLPYRPGSR